MAIQKRTQWGPLIRSNMVRMVLDDGRDAREVAKEWGIPYSTVSTWASEERGNRRRQAEAERRLQQAEADLYPVPGEELTALVNQVQELTEERDLFQEEVTTLETALKKIREITDGLV